MKQVAIYVRVSSEKQADEKTIDSQLAELQEICKDFQSVRVYKDNGWSGETLNRPDIDRLREDVKKDEVEQLLDETAPFGPAHPPAECRQRRGPRDLFE